MDYSQRLSISYYKTIAALNEEHQVFLVQHLQTQKIYVKKVMDFYNKNIYLQLMNSPIPGTANIVELYEENNRLTVIEEYISGDSLEELVSSGKLTQDKVFRYILELCDIVEHLHSINPPVIHRDIKPSNILITKHDHVVLLDFNAAKFFEKQNDSDTVLLGTKGYAAPEQYGFGSSSIRTDIYSIGVLMDTLTSTDSEKKQKWSAIIIKCMQMNPEDRFQSIAELKKTLINAEQPTLKSTKKNRRLDSSFLPPGYRTRKPWKMILATLVYFFIIELSLFLTVENVSGANLFIERIACFFLFISNIFCLFNYRNIHQRMPLCRKNNPVLYILGVALLMVLATLITFLCMIFFEDLFALLQLS